MGGRDDEYLPYKALNIKGNILMHTDKRKAIFI